MGFVLVLKLQSFLSNQAQCIFSAFHLLILMIISFQTHICKWQENVGHCVIKITCNADRGLIALKHTNISYFKGVGWILNTFLCSMIILVCLCACVYAHLQVNLFTVGRVWFCIFPLCPLQPTDTQHSVSGVPCLLGPSQSEHQRPASKHSTSNQNIITLLKKTKQSTANKNIHTPKRLLGCCTRRPHITFLISITSLIALTHPHLHKGKVSY